MNNQPKADQSKTGRNLIVVSVIFILVLGAGGFWYVNSSQTGKILNNDNQKLAKKIMRN